MAQADGLDDEQFLRRVLIVVAVGAVCVAVWKLAYALLLLFGCAVIAVILRTIGSPMARKLHVSASFGVLFALIGLLLVFLLAGWIFGAQFSAAVADLNSRLPKAIASIRQSLADTPFQGALQSMGGSSSTGNLMATVTRVVKSFVGSIADVFFMVVGGIYLALDPKAYERGLLSLAPDATGERLAEAMESAAHQLKLWLLGQFIMMVSVGLLTGIGLWVIGVPAALALGVIAGLLEFVPYFGAILSSVPAILVAFGQNLSLALWTAGLFLMVHVVEGYLLEPLVYRRMVALPAVVTLTSVLASALIFGAMGVVLAAPLAVVFYVAISKLWIQDVMGRPINLPGEGAR